MSAIGRLVALLAAAGRHLLVALGASLCVQAAATPALPVPPGADVDLWPGVGVLAEAGPPLDVEAVAARAGAFAMPGGTPSNLGRRDETVWLRVALQVPGEQVQRRIVEIDYPSLNRVDLYLLSAGQVRSHQRMGNTLARAERALPARTLAAALDLAPGEHELLLRVRTGSSLVLPMTLRTPESFTQAESRVQLVQGVILGLALCMLLYSLAHWVSLRDRAFLDYALLLTGNTLFTLSYFGIGAQYLWPDAPGLTSKMAPMTVMLAVFAGARFIRATLSVHEISPAVDVVLRGAGGVALAALVLLPLGLLEYRQAQTLATVLGLLVTCIVLPVGAIRARRGERVAQYMLVGWAFYTLGALTTAGLLRGLIVPTFWTQHVYPFSTVIEMSAWMAVLGLRVQTIHRTADRARVESETLRTMAHTDALTGLPNRRGLLDRLAMLLPASRPDRLLAVYLLDLDGFKPVNDRYGHDVGDAVLVQVGERLREQVRGSDVVARLGGDEFVVLAAGLPDEATALALGHKLVAAFELPLVAAGQHCPVGLTAGYALAPLDGHTADELLKRADAAMYAGKEQGRRQVQRGGRTLTSVSSATA